MELVQEEIHLQEKWDKLHKAEQEAWDNYNKMSIKQKLASVMDSFANPQESKEIWGTKASESDVQNVTLHLDTVNHNVGVYSDAVDAKGRPVL